MAKTKKTKEDKEEKRERIFLRTLPDVRPERCWVCKGTEFWRVERHGVLLNWNCARCHPNPRAPQGVR